MCSTFGCAGPVTSCPAGNMIVGTVGLSPSRQAERWLWLPTGRLEGSGCPRHR